MYFDSFDNGFGMMPGMDPEFSSPMFNGNGCFPAPTMDMSFNSGFAPSFDSGFGMGMPMSCGYSPTPFGCNPVSMDFNGNVCIDGIPITPNTPPAWMTARAAQAEMHLNQLEIQLNDPNFWMNFIPQGAFNFPSVDWSAVDWQSVPFDSFADSMGPGFQDSMDPMIGMGPQMDTNMGQTMGLESQNSTMPGEELLPCGLTQSMHDQILSKYQANLADCERQLENCGPYNSAARAMLQNNINRLNRNIQDLEKPH